jgi:hypothetical protein
MSQRSKKPPSCPVKEMAHQLAGQIPLKLITFIKKKQAELTELVEFFKRPPPEGHGLHGCLKPDILEKGAPQLASHTFCCYVLLQKYLPLLDLAYLSFGTPSPGVPAWATRSTLTDLGIALLEEQAPWLTTEIQLAVRGIVKWNLIAIQTVAPEQLITQWYLEQLFTGLELLRDAGLQPSLEDVEGVKHVFEEGEKLLVPRH